MKEIAEGILRKLDYLNNQQDKISAELRKMRIERNEAVAKLQCASRHCHILMKLCFLLLILVIIMLGFTIWLLNK